MMYEVSLPSNVAQVQVEPIFKIYEQVCGFWLIPQIEDLLDHYDESVVSKIRDYGDFFVEEGVLEGAPSVALHRIKESERERVRNIIGMELNLQEDDLMLTLDYFRMMYCDRYDNYHNLPRKEVW